MAAPDDRLTPRQRRVRDVRRHALAAALVTARQAADMTQQQLADASGLSRSAIARLEGGGQGISSDRIWELAVALGTKPSELYIAAEADVAVEL